MSKALPANYTRLDYIEVTGTQYIDTGFVPNQDSRIVCEYMRLGGEGVYGARYTTAERNFNLRMNSSNWQAGYGILFNTGVKADYGWHTAEQNKHLFYLDGVMLCDCSEGQTTPVVFKSPKSIIIGGINAQNRVYYSVGKYRTCKIYDNDVMVRDLVPCKNADGVAGMWDKVEGKFYGNGGTDTIIAGPEFVVNPLEQAFKAGFAAAKALYGRG